MNELFALLLILAAIISFLNKMLGAKKTTSSSERPKPIEWPPPWIEPDEFESPVDKMDDRRKTFEDFTAKTTVPGMEVDHREEKPALKSETEKEPEPKKTYRVMDNYSSTVKKLTEVGVDLSSRDELKRGIILAEILGTCKAKQNLRGKNHKVI